ncbi:MAG TPA: hypothetical protein VGR48_10805 [Terriglobales bacterium]|nr:hypothetical protein [Terriglobales bacterium]
MRPTSFSFYLLTLVCITGVAFAQNRDMVKRSFLAHASSKVFHATPHDLTNGQAHSRFGIYGIDSIPNFNDHFFADGFDFNGNPNRHWYTNTVGNPPQMGGTTVINAPIQPVSIELDDANGNLRYVGGHPLISDATQFVAPTMASPVFSNFNYSSGTTPTQISDAIQRAQYFNGMKPNWHTLLGASPQPGLTMHISQSATCPTGPNAAGCNYVFSLNADGTCCFFILVNDNPPDFVFDNGFAGEVITDITTNAITTKDISTFLFPNVYLFFGDITQCCVLGYHTYFFAPGTDPEQRWVLNYSSWISPGLFGSAFTDVTAVSHEIGETYNDPFVASDNVHDLTPFWLAPNGNCGEVLETGDVIEGLPHATFPIMLNGFLYHPQNEALQQWFEFQSPSSALDGAYSYPDTTVLTQPSAPQNFNCLS